MSFQRTATARPSRSSGQLSLLGRGSSFYGGGPRTTRKSREGRRPLAVKKTMHVVMRSSRATGSRSFRARENRFKIDEILRTHAARNGVRLISYANVGNHLHLHVKLGDRDGYPRFIRAVTSAIAMHVMRWSRWTAGERRLDKGRFWDYRPYTNVVTSWRGFLKLKDYIRINQYEGMGIPRKTSEALVRSFRDLWAQGTKIIANSG